MAEADLARFIRVVIGGMTSEQAHKALPSARMVVVQGGGNHGQSLSIPASTCVNGYLNRYLATGALPRKPGLVNATCAALPAPAAG